MSETLHFSRKGSLYKSPVSENSPSYWGSWSCGLHQECNMFCRSSFNAQLSDLIPDNSLHSELKKKRELGDVAGFCWVMQGNLSALHTFSEV